jgi:hypothetical protein
MTEMDLIPDDAPATNDRAIFAEADEVMSEESVTDEFADGTARREQMSHAICLIKFFIGYSTCVRRRIVKAQTFTFLNGDS